MTEAPGQTVRGLPRAVWLQAVRRARHGFVRHRGIDSAAALSYFAALTLFPGALAVVSALALANGRGDAASLVLAIVDEFAQEATVEALRDPVDQLLTLPIPGLALAVGLALATWTLSGYATAFGRAVNTVYEVQEGRPGVAFRGLMILLALALLVLFSAIIALLIATPRVISAAGIPEPWASTVALVRWPVLLALLAVVVATLYYVTPNVRHDRVRWVSIGAGFAIVTWAAATGLFSLYVGTVGQYDRLYGWLGGGLVLLLWLFLSNLVLVLGAELDAELVRVRQLRAGIPAEEVIALPARSTRRTLMLARQRADDIARSRAMREESAGEG